MNISYGEDLILSIFPGNPQRFWRYLITVALVAIAYKGSAQFTLSWLGLGDEASPVWVGAGIALAALFLQGKRLWVGVAIGAFWLNLSLGASFLVSLGSVIGCTLQAVVGAMGLRRLDFNPKLERLKDAYALIVFGAIIAPLINATISTLVNCWVNFIPWHQFGLNWGTLWLGDSMGILVFTPLLLLIFQDSHQRILPPNYPPQQILEAVLCWSLLGVLSWLVFQSRTTFALSDYPLEYLPFPFVVWAALRFRVWGAVLASLIVSGMAIGGVLQGIGPFVVKTGSTLGAILLLQTFMAVVTITALVLAAASQEVQGLNSNLESQVAERTLQLEEKMQEVQRLYELKDVFLQAVSHDLRTSMMGLILMLKGTQNSPGETVALPRRILDLLIENSDRQLTLINALSEDHFNQGRKIELHCQPLCLNELLSQILADLQPLFSSNQAQLTTVIPQTLPPVKADPTQLRCVFHHLLTNALKHNLPGVKITLTVRVERDMLHCAIADDGIGMSKQQCDRLFKLYVRGLYSQHLTGIGLGLYLCRQIINAHGGQISVTSVPTEGSTFNFSLPFDSCAIMNL
ncbi:sensor histidine kinase [Coleofasciculus sp.]|uniref:sensor histidine kinase n=1 Tax=Coleofasciculus sp. TaxID=3100458 RepID=UPI003A1B024C